MSEQWRVRAYDLNTGVFICDLPANNLKYDRRLNDAGSLSFDLSLNDPRVQAAAAPFVAYGGTPTALYVERNGVLVWGGIQWTSSYQDTTGVLSIGGKEFVSYFAQRICVVDYSASNSKYAGGVDPALLMRDVMVDTQNPALGGVGSSINLGVVANPSPLPHLIPGYPSSQVTVAGTIISDLVQTLTPGFGTLDYQQTVQYNTQGQPTQTMYVLSPRAGRPAGQTGVVLDLSSTVDFTWPTDATQSGNVITMTGTGTGTQTPKATVVSSQVPVGGLGQQPRLDYVESTAAQSQSLIDQMANGLASQFGKPSTTPTVTVLTDNPAQPLGSWAMGDDARLMVSAGHPRFPNGLDQYWRIVQESVTVPDAGAATAVLTLNIPPVY